MKHVFSILIKFLCFALALLLLAIVCVRLALLNPHYYQPVLVRWISQHTGADVHIRAIHVDQARFSPQLKLEQVSFSDDLGKPHLKIQEVRLSVSVVRSIWHRRLLFKHLYVSGLHLKIQKLADQTLRYNGLRFKSLSHTPRDWNLQSVSQILRQQGDIALQDIAIDWEDYKGSKLHISELQAVLHHHLHATTLAGNFRVLQNPNAKVHFVIKWPHAGGQIMQAYVAGWHLHLPGAYMQTLFPQISLKKGLLSHLQLWTTWRAGHLERAQAIFKAKNTVVQSTALQKSVRLNQLAAHVLWEPLPHGFQISADRIHMDADHHTWPTQRLYLKIVQHPQKISTLQLDAISLSDLTSLGIDSPLVSKNIRHQLSCLQPVGVLHDFFMRLKQTDVNGKHTHTAYLIYARITKGGVQAFENMPKLQGIQGMFLMNNAGGRFYLTGQKLIIGTSPWFVHPYVLRHYRMHARWQQYTDGVWVRVLDSHLIDAHLALRAEAKLFFPTDGRPNYVQLQGAFSEQGMDHIKDYIPNLTLLHHEHLDHWLRTAFVSGDGVDGQILLQGPLSHFPFDDHTGVFKAHILTHNATFYYKKDWPNITHLNAAVLFHNRGLKIFAKQAQIMATRTGPIFAQIANLADPKLKVQGQVLTPMQEAVRFIHASPLQQTIGQALSYLRLTGLMHLMLDLTIPLYQDHLSTVRGDITLLSHVAVQIPAAHLQLKNVQGTLHFTQAALNAKALRATWDKQPVSFQLSTVKNSLGTFETIISAKGHAAFLRIKKAYALHFLKNTVQGGADYQLKLHVLHPTAGETQIAGYLDSNLQGLSLRLPYPLDKSAKVRRPVHVKVQADAATLHVQADYAKMASLALLWQHTASSGWRLQKGNLRFGQKPASIQQVKSGVRIDGTISHIMLPDIARDVLPLIAKKPKGNPDLPYQLDLYTDKLQIFGAIVPHLHMVANTKKAHWVVQLESPDVTGTVIFQDLKGKIIGNFTRFHYISAQGGMKNISRVDPGSIPDLQLTCQDFHYNDRSLGRLFLLTHSKPGVLAIDRVSINDGTTDFNAQGFWKRVKTGRWATQLYGTLHTQNMGLSLKNLKVTTSLLGGKGNMRFHIRWPDAIYHFQPSRLDGYFALQLNHGSILHIKNTRAAELGIGKILNLLSLRSISRHLSLDFSDLLQKGFIFDIMSGSFQVKNGISKTQDFYIKGQIAKLSLAGSINFARASYSLKMQLIPYLTGSLPVAATLIGGPVAGAATWVGNKLFRGVLNRAFEKNYKVTGSFENPILESMGRDVRAHTQ